MTTKRTSESAAEYVAGKMQTKSIDKIVGQPTIATYNILEDQLAVAASAVKTAAWGGRHGHLALLL